METGPRGPVPSCGRFAVKKRITRIWVALVFGGAGFLLGDSAAWLARRNALNVLPAIPAVLRDVSANTPATSNTWSAIVAHQQIAARPSASHQLTKTPSRTKLPDDPFGANTVTLERLADAGDDDAMYALAKGYRDCQFIPPRDDADLDKRADQSVSNLLEFLEDAKTQAPQIEQANTELFHALHSIPRAEFVQQVRASLQRQRMECAGVDEAIARASWFDWERRAAQQGNREAQLRFWLDLARRADMLDPEALVADKHVAVQSLQEALLDGDARALAAIGIALHGGFFSPPDTLLGYAYLAAGLIGTDRPLPWIETDPLGRLLGLDTPRAQIDHELRGFAAELSPAQQMHARELGEQLYAQCCAGSHQ
jgi:hypothetical protein